MYRTGVGVQRDEYRAFELCKLAAKAGLLEAQFQLGLMYLQGEGVTENDDEARKWIWAAADRDYPQAKEVLQFIISADFGMGC
jgi:TPR repeat protein